MDWKSNKTKQDKTYKKIRMFVLNHIFYNSYLFYI